MELNETPGKTVRERLHTGYDRIARVLICTWALSASFHTQNLDAQSGPSFSVNYEQFFSSRLSAPPNNPAFLQDVGIRISSLYLEGSFARVFSGGRTVLGHTISYRRLDLDYENWDVAQGGRPIENAHEIDYNLSLQHRLSPRWSMLAFLTPGLASDFEGTISAKDITFQAALVFIRPMSETLALGFGAAYSNEFGYSYPLPVLAVQWNNGSNMKFEAILPVNMAFSYAPSSRVQLGLALEVEGNRYHGDPNIFGVSNPQMRYSVAYLVPSVTLPVTNGLSLHFAAGTSLMRRFEFFDGNTEQQDYSLRQQRFIRLGLKIGG